MAQWWMPIADAVVHSPIASCLLPHWATFPTELHFQLSNISDWATFSIWSELHFDPCHSIGKQFVSARQFTTRKWKNSCFLRSFLMTKISDIKMRIHQGVYHIYTPGWYLQTWCLYSCDMRLSALKLSWSTSHGTGYVWIISLVHPQFHIFFYFL